MKRPHSVDHNANLLPTLLLVLFIGLKLTGHIDWSWWWVMSPMWIPLVLAVLVMIPWVFYTALKSARNK